MHRLRIPVGPDQEPEELRLPVDASGKRITVAEQGRGIVPARLYRNREQPLVPAAQGPAVEFGELRLAGSRQAREDREVPSLVRPQAEVQRLDVSSFKDEPFLIGGFFKRLPDLAERLRPTGPRRQIRLSG